MHELSNLSMWHATMSDEEWGPGRPALGGDLDVDVAIVGAGYTGLWTAYYLLQRQPTLKVVVLEANVVGFGASGRNGGWCSALLPMGLDAVAAESSRDAAVRLQRVMHDAVDEVGRVVAVEGIECDYQRGGYVSLARSSVQLDRSRAHIDHLRSYGFTEDEYRLLGRAEAAALCGATKVEGGTYTPHCAAIHPARLARGLGRTVERLGATIYEHTPVLDITPGHARTLVPIYSLMVATEPLPDDFWQETGLHGRATFNDGRHMIIYGQRTADNRFAFGGRGAPYHFGSKVSHEYDRHEEVHALLHETLRELFPSIGDAAITHRWGGAVAAARDWWCSASFDPVTGLANAGAYVGDGVGTTNLSGRTLADLITREPSELTALPWVGHRSKKWEPEPFRWMGINTMVRLPISADAHEAKSGTRAKVREAVIDRLTGH
jgi:glycine/D-amino acid oxidase-like deaminating enzyme